MSKKKYIILALVLFITINSNAQENSNKMRKLDIKAFEENNVRGVWEYSTADSTYVVEIGNGAPYLEAVTLKGTTLKKYYSYYKNGDLESTQESYFVVSVGITRQYDRQGVLIHETDEDEDYEFSMEDLRKLLIKIFNHDIRDERTREFGMKVYRHSFQLGFDGIPTYTIFKPTKSRFEGHNLVLDGKTGGILSHRDENNREMINDEDYIKENEIYLHPTKKSSPDWRDWTPLID